jgi:hypothetical protein
VKKTAVILLFFVVAGAAGAAAGEEPAHTFKPEHGYVPDAATAIKIAVAVWEPIYGEAKIASEKPYRAVLQDGVWVVEGSLHAGLDGGAAIAEIAQEDGRILRVSHGK